MLRRLLILACATALAVGVTAAAALGARSVQTVTVTVCPTGAGNPADYTFVDGNGGTHVRGLPIENGMYAGACYTSDQLGTVDYSESFNMWADGSNTAWCSFDMEFDGTSYQGECNGTLAAGHLVGHGGGGATLKGTYELIDPATNVYRLTIAFASN
jgi:hypothetical protein